MGTSRSALSRPGPGGHFLEITEYKEYRQHGKSSLSFIIAGKERQKK
jgi:hypothetical protein